jgi:hypothetical protein
MAGPRLFALVVCMSLSPHKTAKSDIFGARISEVLTLSNVRSGGEGARRGVNYDTGMD